MNLCDALEGSRELSSDWLLSSVWPNLPPGVRAHVLAGGSLTDLSLAWR
jgi:hypothetical protein